MKIFGLIISACFLGSPHASLFAVTPDREPGVAQPGWETFHAEMEQKIEREVEAARAEAEDRQRREIEARLQEDSRKGFDQRRSGVLHSPENLVDGATLIWLSSALRRPMPEEASLRHIFREERVPEELIYVGLVESGYNRNAISSAGAVGPWQFIGETGRRYGLKQGKTGDERRDLLKSTRAAARYLRDLHDLLGDWTLAIAGYNAGEYRVLKAMQQVRARNFWALRHLLPGETAAYVPRVLSAISIAERMRPFDGFESAQFH
jgi:hypothetical protein